MLSYGAPHSGQNWNHLDKTFAELVIQACDCTHEQFRLTKKESRCSDDNNQLYAWINTLLIQYGLFWNCTDVFDPLSLLTTFYLDLLLAILFQFASNV